MMGITFDDALELKYGQTLYHSIFRNADGSPQRWRVNGKVKTWVRFPDRLQVPLKHGLWDHDYLTESSLHLLSLDESDAMKEH